MKKLGLLFMIMLMGVMIHAQEKWTLEECIRYAIENNLQVRQSVINKEFANLSEKQAFHSRFPSLSASTNLGSNFGRTIDPVTNQFITEAFVSNNLSLNAGVVLFNGFRISNAIKQSRIDVDAADYDLDQMKRDIALSVANAFINVVFSEENLAIARAQLVQSQEQLKQTQMLIDAGSRPVNEALDIEAQVANNEQNVIQAENNLTIGILNLKQLLRIEPSQDIELDIPENIAPTTDPDMVTFNDVYKEALQTQSNIKAEDLRVESARLGEKIAKAGLVPSITLGGSLGTNYSNRARILDGFTTQTVAQEVTVTLPPFDPTIATIETEQEIPNFVTNPYFDQLDQNLSYGFGLSVRVPIYENYTNQINVQRAELSTRQAETNNARVRDQLKVTVQQAIADAKAAKRKLNAAEKSLAAQKASFENTNKRYEIGAANPFELVTVRTSLQQAEVNALISKYEYIFATKVLDFYMGKPLSL